MEMGAVCQKIVTAGCPGEQAVKSIDLAQNGSGPRHAFLCAVWTVKERGWGVRTGFLTAWRLVRYLTRREGRDEPSRTAKTNEHTYHS